MVATTPLLLANHRPLGGKTRPSMTVATLFVVTLEESRPPSYLGVNRKTSGRRDMFRLIVSDSVTTRTV